MRRHQRRRLPSPSPRRRPRLLPVSPLLRSTMQHATPRVMAMAILRTRRAATTRPRLRVQRNILGIMVKQAAVAALVAARLTRRYALVISLGRRLQLTSKPTLTDRKTADVHPRYCLQKHFRGGLRAGGCAETALARVTRLARRRNSAASTGHHFDQEHRQSSGKW